MNRQELIDSINTYLGDTVYVCTRVWVAWNYGTMSRDDFHLASEDENVASDIADIVMKAIKPLESKLELMYDTYMTANHEFGLVWKYANEIQKLKAENAQLKADNLDLMKQVETNGKALDLACEMIGYSTISCPHMEHGYQCESCICIGLPNDKMCEVELQCWKEYFTQKAGE